MLGFKTSDIQIQIPKLLKKWHFTTSMKNTHTHTHVAPKISNNSQNAVPKSFKIDRNPSLDPRVCAPQCPWIARSGCNRHAKWHVLGTKNNNIRAPRHCELEKHVPSKLHPRISTNFNRQISKTIQKTTSQSRGAGGMGKALR